MLVETINANNCSLVIFAHLAHQVFTIRELAISIIGRLTVHNPAYVMPSLRKTLIQLLTDLEYSVVGYDKTPRGIWWTKVFSVG